MEMLLVIEQNGHKSTMVVPTLKTAFLQRGWSEMENDQFFANQMFIGLLYIYFAYLKPWESSSTIRSKKQ